MATTTTKTATKIKDNGTVSAGAASGFRLNNPPPPGKAVTQPILTRITTDNTWLYSLPIPACVKEQGATTGGEVPKKRTKAYYHILVDPWLAGEEIAIGYRWFRVSKHMQVAAFENGNDIDRLISEIEAAAAIGNGAGQDDYRQKDDEVQVSTIMNGKMIDLICIVNANTDHCHYDTLTSLDPSIPVCATSKPAAVIRKWKHFDTVVDMLEPAEKGSGNSDGKDGHHYTSIVPDWIRIYAMSRLVCFSMLIAFPLASEDGVESAGAIDTEKAYQLKSISYCPHGVDPPTLKAFHNDIENHLLNEEQVQSEDKAISITTLARAKPQPDVIGLIHPVDGTSVLGFVATFEAHNGLKLQRMTGAKYWFRTHVAPLKETGIITWVETFQEVTFEEALEQEKKEMQGKEGGVVELERPLYLEMENGESYHLL